MKINSVSKNAYSFIQYKFLLSLTENFCFLYFSKNMYGNGQEKIALSSFVVSFIGFWDDKLFVIYL